MSDARFILCSAVKNEAPFLVEWVAYHRAIGFDRIVVVSNDSDDGTTELLNALHDGGFVHHIHHSVAEGESPQGKAANAINDAGLISDGAWAIWLDADEFLNVHAGKGRVADLVGAMGEAQAMLIPWRIFGDSGHATFPGRFITPDFTRAAAREFDGNKIIKAMFRHIDGKTRLSAIANHRPHLTQRKAYRPEQALNAAGKPIDMSFRPNHRWIVGIEGKANFSIPETDYAWDLAQINHYMLRTREMFDLKAHRGRGFLNIIKGVPVVRARHTPEFFAANNRNEDEDKSILRHRRATTLEMNRLLKDKSVQTAHEAGLLRTVERIEQMRTESSALPVAAPAAAEPATLFVPTITMPDREKALVERIYAEKDVILEYGTGGSTMLAASQSHSLVMGVESDRAWADNLQAVLDRDFPQANVRLHWADIGPTGKWGRPSTHKTWERFHLYPLSVWDMPWFQAPDLILIDGRFRVGCLLTALFRIQKPTTVLYDDYSNRQHYVDAAETFVKPVEVVGRMARFELMPTPYPVERMAEITGLLARPD